MSLTAFSLTSASPERTRLAGEVLGNCISGRTVIALEGGLGSGKTVFVQGLAKGLEVPEGYYVTSPTYTLLHEYPGRHSLHHADLYRLQGSDDAEDIGLFEALSGDGVVAVEWAERLHPSELQDRLTVSFEITGENTRKILFAASGLDALNLLCEFEKSVKEKRWE